MSVKLINMSGIEQKNKKILLVDDDEFLLDMYSTKFRGIGFEVETVFEGETALKYLKEKAFDVLLLDLIMPKMDGFEVLEELKEIGLRDNLFVIVLSNQSESEDIERVKKLGVDGYIIKATAVPSEVLDEVQKIINGEG